MDNVNLKTGKTCVYVPIIDGEWWCVRIPISTGLFCLFVNNCMKNNQLSEYYERQVKVIDI